MAPACRLVQYWESRPASPAVRYTVRTCRACGNVIEDVWVLEKDIIVLMGDNIEGARYARPDKDKRLRKQ